MKLKLEADPDELDGLSPKEVEIRLDRAHRRLKSRMGIAKGRQAGDVAAINELVDLIANQQKARAEQLIAELAG